MTKTQLNKIVVEFREQVLPGRPECEKLASVMMRPHNSDGTFRILGPQHDFYERRACLNGMFDYYWQMYEINGPLHTYSRTNPKRVGGALGWLNLSGFDCPENGSPDFVSTIVLNGTRYSVTWPTKGAGADKVVDIQGSWVTVTEYAGLRLKLNNGQINPKHGRSDGELKHAYIQQLVDGVQLTVAVTVSPDPNKPGQWWTRLQDTALYHQRLVALDSYDEARQKLIDFRRQSSATFAARDRLSKVEGAGTQEEAQAALQTLDNRANNVESGRTLFVNGTQTDLAKIMPGIYNIVVVNGSGTTQKVIQRGVAISKFTGAVILERMLQSGGRGLEVVQLFAS